MPGKSVCKHTVVWCCRSLSLLPESSNSPADVLVFIALDISGFVRTPSHPLLCLSLWTSRGLQRARQCGLSVAHTRLSHVLPAVPRETVRAPEPAYGSSGSLAAGRRLSERWRLHGSFPVWSASSSRAQITVFFLTANGVKKPACWMAV